MAAGCNLLKAASGAFTSQDYSGRLSASYGTYGSVNLDGGFGVVRVSMDALRAPVKTGEML